MNPHRRRSNTKRKILEESGTLNQNPDKVSDQLFQQRAFFDSTDLLQVKYEMLRCVEKKDRTVTKAARDFGFSRRYYYEIQKQFTQAGFQGLIPEKREPRSAHKLDDEVLRFVMAALDEAPILKAPALARLIQQQFQLKVHPRSIEKALRRKKNVMEK
ncbi:MAG: helix-turn-helix domain containing protein [Halobacteria archaeon]|nr:helix-turn-helix domain containing protein [Halobacteria archaeon]